jgi:hypothetical protein
MSLDPASAHAQHIDILIIYPVAGREARRLIQTSRAIASADSGAMGVS